MQCEHTKSVGLTEHVWQADAVETLSYLVKAYTTAYHALQDVLSCLLHILCRLEHCALQHGHRLSHLSAIALLGNLLGTPGATVFAECKVLPEKGLLQARTACASRHAPSTAIKFARAMTALGYHEHRENL